MSSLIRKYRVNFNPRRWFFKYEVQELRYVMDPYNNGASVEIRHLNYWYTIKRFRKSSGAVELRKELEFWDKEYIDKPDWFIDNYDSGRGTLRR